MAIQLRRGAYNNFDPSKLLPGEVAVVQSGDPNTRNGKAVYIATLSGEIKRFAFVEDVEEIVYNVSDDIAEEINEQVEENVSAAQAAATAAQQAATSIVVDSALDATSTHALQNKVVTSEINTLKANLSELQEGGYVADQQKIQEKIDNWLEEHPEAVTSLEDGAVTEAKIHASAVSNTKIQNGAVTDDKTADTYKNLFYDEVTVSTGRTSNTDYYLTTVPKLDSENNIIPVSLSYNSEKNPLEQAWEKGSTITVNGYGSVLYDGASRNGIAICDGTVVNTRSYEGVAPDNMLYLGMKPNRTIVEYKMNSAVTPAQMLADGCTNVFNCYFKLVENGQIVSALEEETIVINGTTITDDMRNPLMLMGVKANGDIVFLACDGRSVINDGLTYGEAGNILISQGCDAVYNLDGGGSACLVVRGSKLNRNSESDGTAIRNIHYALNVIKPSANTPTRTALAQIGVEKQRIIEQIIPYINAVRDAPSISALTLTPQVEGVTIVRSKFTRSLKTVTLSAVFTTSSSIAKNTVLFTVPSDAKPGSTVDFFMAEAAGTLAFGSLTSNGNMSVLLNALPAGTYRINMSWQVT